MIRLKKDSCCCGATKKLPCLCMINGKKCSHRPICLCFKLIKQQNKKLKLLS